MRVQANKVNFPSFFLFHRRNGSNFSFIFFFPFFLSFSRLKYICSPSKVIFSIFFSLLYSSCFRMLRAVCSIAHYNFYWRAIFFFFPFFSLSSIILFQVCRVCKYFSPLYATEKKIKTNIFSILQ